MNRLRHAAFCATVTAAFVLAGFVVNAGDYRYPGEKQTTPSPALDKKLPARDVFRFGEELSTPSGFDVLSVPIISGNTPRIQKNKGGANSNDWNGKTGWSSGRVNCRRRKMKRTFERA